jgi:hypothetical protein
MHAVLQALGRRSWPAAAPIPPVHATRSLWQHLCTAESLPQLLPDVSWPTPILCLLTAGRLPNEKQSLLDESLPARFPSRPLFRKEGRRSQRRKFPSTAPLHVALQAWS